MSERGKVFLALFEEKLFDIICVFQQFSSSLICGVLLDSSSCPLSKFLYLTSNVSLGVTKMTSAFNGATGF